MRRLVVSLTFLAACGGSVASSSSGGSVAESTTTPSCSRVGGPYERGKGGGDPLCCAGLTQRLVPTQLVIDGGATCVQTHAAVFICLQGKCGDGVCEPSENQPCGCPQDCSGVDGG